MLVRDENIIRSHVTGKTREFLVAHPDWRGDTEQEQIISNYIQRRNRGEPLAYILGYKEFYGRKFKVSPDVLIPRPETEALIDTILPLEPQKVLDVGTGSGCIAVTLSLESPETEVAAVDISDKALAVARENAQNLGGKVNFLQSDLLKSIKDDFDLIVANLPYVNRYWDWIDESLRYEPETALFAEDNGLETVKQLIVECLRYFKDKSGHRYLVLEIDPSQKNDVIDFAKKDNFRINHNHDFEHVITFEYTA